MKKELLRGFTMLTLIVVLALATAVTSANAQSANSIAADIPFDFSVGYKIMPAGGYTVKTVSTTGNALMIQTADGGMAAVRLSDETERAKNIPQARLVFHRYGERYFLAEVWNGFDKKGRQLLKSLEESSLESELASISAKSETAKNTYETVEILAVLR
jgi:hypothetical protein